VKPRRLVHRGTVLAAGFLVDGALLGESEARRRILALTGVEGVWRVEAGLVVRLRETAWVDCARAPGAPLVAVGGVLCAAPLDRDEIDALAPPNGAALLVRAGEVVVVSPEEGEREDLVAWIDVGAWSAVEVEPLGAPLAAPAAALVPVPADARAALGIGALPREGQEVAAALARSGKGTGTRPGHRESALSAVASFLAALVARLFAPSRSGASSTTTGRALAAVPQSSRAGDSWLARARAALQNAVARLLVRTRLAGLVTRRQAEYLAHTMAMFDEGDFERALRHAIPLGSGTGGPRPPALSVPSPRDALTIHPSRAAAGSSLGVGGDLFHELRTRYRKAFERLAAEGRIQEAAFVLAELLDAAEEAVSFLERHGKLRLAAELAEGRALSPGLVIRQWFLAGDRARAVRIARRTGAFADAITRLEPSHHEHAVALRMLWADKLAEAGAYAAAVDVVWPVEAARPLARAWIDRGIELSGPTGARLLARKARVAPEEMASIVALSRALLREGGAEARRVHLAFANALLFQEPTPEIRVLARACARALLPQLDVLKGGTLIKRLLEAAGDAVLRADTQGLGADTAPSTPDVRFRVHARTEAGAIAVLDAALLPGGRALVALGEAGVRLLSPEGKTLVHFNQPAHRLVVSDHGDRALALAPRGEAWRIARIDLAGRRARPWCDARFDEFAPDFDGSVWFIGHGETVHAIDVLEEGWQSIWDVTEPDRPVGPLARAANECSFLLGLEVWTVGLPSFQLRARKLLQKEVNPTGLAVSPAGAIWAWLQLQTRAWPAVRKPETESWLELSPGQEARAAGPIVASEDLAALPLVTDGGREVVIFDAHKRVEMLRIGLEGAETVRVRIQGASVTVADDRGRVLAVAPESGAILGEWRVL
jgi:hypothetical protein